jgi:predicted  nucleic acid-binding Zn-ribbon protein
LQFCSQAQVASIRSKYEDKINKLTSEINDLRRKYQEVQRKISDKRATNEALLRTMKGNIEALKVEKMKMLKKLRDRDQQIREREQEHDRELSRLRRREKQIQEHAKKLESSNQMNVCLYWLV